MSNGWTGGQYIVYRAVLGVYLLVHFLALVPQYAGLTQSSSGLWNIIRWVEAPAFTVACLGLAVGLSVAFNGTPTS